MTTYHKLNNQMKKLAIILVALCLTMQLQAQEKGHFLTVKGGLGSTGLQYDLLGPYKSGDRFNKLGWNAEIGYQYFFHKNWGIATGIGISGYRTLGIYPDKYRTDNYFDLGAQVDDEGDQYRLHANLTNWHEMQKTYFLEVPLMLMYQHKFGEKKNSGFFVGVGAKLLLPVQAKYNVMDGKDGDDKRLWITGYYENGNVTFGGEGDPELKEHGFAGIYNPYETLDWQGEAPVKMSVALSGEAGFLIGLSKRVDLTLSAYVDYGLTNMKANGSTLKDAYKNTFKKTEAADCPDMLEAPDSYLSNANDAVGKGIVYNGMVMSNRTDRINSLAFGGKIGLRIKLGKVSSSSSSSPSSDASQSFSEKKAAAQEKRTMDSLKRKMDVLNQKMDKLLNQQSTGTQESTNEALAVIRGIVMDTVNHKPIAATVRILDEDDNLLGIQLSDPNSGKFEITDIPKGKTAHLEATNPSYFPETRDDIEISEKGSAVQTFYIAMTKMEVGSSVVVKKVFFDLNKSILKPASITEINNIFKIMNENPTLKVEISGHTDSQGTHEHNMTLSKNRAAAVVKALVDRGISSSRLISVGYGPDQPIATNETDEGRAQNRRVELKILEL
jgi:outer membrane protein OmpA-like peptidoglycan-associated protein